MNDETTHEDGTILSLLDNLQGVSEDGVPAGLRGDESTETLARLYVEVLGLIPFGLAPVTPAPAIKERILALVTDETQEVQPPPAMTSGREADAAASAIGAPKGTAIPTPRPIRVVTPVRPAESPMVERAERAAVAPPPGRVARSTPPRRWPLALAAVLILALLGASSWLLSELFRTGNAFGQQSHELVQKENQIDELTKERDQLAAELAAMRADFGLVTNPTVGMSAMKPAANSPQQQAKGTLYVAADHQHWYLSVHDLQPLGQGRRYQLWFLGDSGAVSGGTLDAQPGAPVNLSSTHMPADTKAIVITLEPADQGAPRPTGPEVLRATGFIQL